MSIVKLLHSCSTFTIVFSRFFIALLLTLPAVIRSPRIVTEGKNIKLQILNGVLRTAAVYCTYYAYSHLPIAFAASIGFTGPLFTVCLALLILRERIRWYKWIAVLVGYSGVLLMVHPEQAVITTAILASLLANLLAGLAQIATRKLSQTDSSFSILFFTNVISVLLASFGLTLYWATPVPQDIPLIIAVGVFGIISQFSYIQALRHAEVSFVAPFEYLRLLFAIPIGFFLFNEVPKSLSIVGALIIISSSAFLTFEEIFTKRKASEPK